MKICRQALYAQVIDEKGTVRACGWAGYYILGNLIESSMHEIYHSEAANRFHKSLIDKTYDYCNKENCPYMANGTLEEQLVEIDEIPYYPEILSLAYEKRCNYNCTCCISKNNTFIEEDNRKKIETELLKVIPHVKILSANGLGELFVSDSILEVISKWTPIDRENAEFEIETNGSLFNETNWKKIENVGKYPLKVFLTVHSFDEAAYQLLSGTNLKIEVIENNLRFVKQLREKNVINYLEIATVVQERNFRTLPEFVDRCINEFGADKVRLRRFLPEKAMDENIEWFFDIRNPLHPYHKEYINIMKNPIFKDPKVFIWTGDHLSNRGDIPSKANYSVMKSLFLIDDIGNKICSKIREKGYNSFVLYAISDVGKALIKVLSDTNIKIPYMYDRNTNITEWEGLEVIKPLQENIEKESNPIIISLIARNSEISENLVDLGFKGEILSLQDIIIEIESENV